MMVNLMRTNQRWLMIIISVLVIISMFWLFSNRSQLDRTGSDHAGTLYGRSVSVSELGRIQRRLDVARSLGTYNVLQAASVYSRDPGEAPITYLVLEHEAEKMGIQPTDDEVRIAGEKLFQGPNGEYDQAKYAEFVNAELNPRGLALNQIDELVRMNLMVGKLREVLAATVIVSPTEALTRYEEQYAKTSASVVRLKTADAAAVPEPTDEEIKKYFNDQKDQFKQPERRKVQYVKFSLDDAQKKLPLKARNEAQQALSDHSVQFLEKLLDLKGKEDFAATASADKLSVQETPEFSEDQSEGFEEAKIPQFIEAAFKLTGQNPDSDVPLATSDAYYDLHLAGISPERQLSLDEARPKIIAAMKAERANAALAARAEEIRTKIAEAMKGGRPFADAVKDAGQTAQEVPPFSASEPARALPDAAAIATAAESLKSGELGKFTPTPDGGFLVFVQSRLPVDQSRYDSAKDGIMAQSLSQKTEYYFYEWLRASRESANPQFNLLRSQG